MLENEKTDDADKKVETSSENPLEESDSGKSCSSSESVSVNPSSSEHIDEGVLAAASIVPLPTSDKKREENISAPQQLENISSPGKQKYLRGLQGEEVSVSWLINCKWINDKMDHLHHSIHITL